MINQLLTILLLQNRLLSLSLTARNSCVSQTCMILRSSDANNDVHTNFLQTKHTSNNNSVTGSCSDFS